MISSFHQFSSKKFPGVNTFPSSHAMVADFIAHLFIQNYQPSTISSYVSAISFVHKINFYEDPTDSFLIKKILKGAHNLRRSSDTRLPITKEILQKLVHALPFVIADFYNRIMLKAMMSLAYYCFLRIGEITVKKNTDFSKVMQISNVFFEKEQEHVIGVRVTLTDYKHSDLQPKTISITRDKENLLCPVESLLNYFAIAKHRMGPLFQFVCGAPVSYSYFNSSLKSLLSYVGLNPDVYKGHSFRIGAATAAAARGVSLSVIQSMGRWKSNAFKNYIRMQNF